MTHLRWVLTFINKDNLRVMAHNNDGRHTFPDKQAVYAWLKLMYKNNNLDTITSIFGNKPKFKAVQTACYDNFESCRTVFKN